MTTTAESTEAAKSDGRVCSGCPHPVRLHGSSSGCLALGTDNAFCPCAVKPAGPTDNTSELWVSSLGIMPEPVAQDLLGQVEAIEQAEKVPRVYVDGAGSLTASAVRVLSDSTVNGVRMTEFRVEGASPNGVDSLPGLPPSSRVLSDRCLHGLSLGFYCASCYEVIGAARAPRTDPGAIPTAVVGELAGPHVNDPREWARRASQPTAAGRALADLNAEVARAAASASAAARELAERHSAEWAALTDKAVAGVTDPRQRARLLRTVAHAIELSTRQGCELVMSAHSVLDAELAKLAPEKPAAPEPTVDALISGDPTTVCRALWRGEAAEDGALAIAALEEWVHGHVGERELEERFAELLSELLLVLGGPHSATS